MIAILSDIHGNLEGLQAVLADAEDHGAEAIYCLGDVIGYGPNPRECLDLAQGFRHTILGNHDQGALFDPFCFCGPAERAIFWTREQLESGDESRVRRERRWEFLAERPRVHVEDGCMFVHGSARNPLNEYVFPEDIYNPYKMDGIFSLVERCAFQGHTHVPGIFLECTECDEYEFLAPEEIGFAYRLNGQKTLCNVGSVGQPRDGDARSCYVLFDGDTIRFRRVCYDVELTRRKIYAIEELDRVLGDRLLEGR